MSTRGMYCFEGATQGLQCMKRFYTSGLLLLLLLVPTFAVSTEVDEPRRLIRSLSDRIQELMQQHEAELQGHPEKLFEMVAQVILPHVDLPRLSSLTLGKHWRSATPEQQQAFSEAFKDLLIRTYATALYEFKLWDMEFLSEIEGSQENDVLIRTLMQRPGAQPMKINYRMHRTERGWLAYDVSIEGISLATSYRSSFTQIIRRQGIDGLIQRISQHTVDRS